MDRTTHRTFQRPAIAGIPDFFAINLHKAPVDSRKQINGLAAIVQSAMGRGLSGKGLFNFTSKKQELVKPLYGKGSGFALWMHRLEKETFRWPSKRDGEIIVLTSRELRWLLAGADIRQMKPQATLAYSSLS